MSGPVAAAQHPLPIAVPAYTPQAGRVRSVVGGGFSVPEHYVHAIERAGGRALMLSANDPRPETVLDLAGALLLTGGGDVDPARYGAAPHPSVYDLEQARDAFEMTLLREAMARRMPVLAICRGLQVVNVALGGTLHQHVPDLPGVDVHRASDDGELYLHAVEARPGTELARLCGTRIAAGSSRHHQAVDTVAAPLVVTACAADGVIEGLELRDPGDAGWFLAVQWHPEETAAEDPRQQALFDELVRRGRDYVS